MIDLLIDEDITLDIPQQAIEEAVLFSCFEAKNITEPSLCIRFSNDAVVHKLNAQWRDKDSVTDVLSFPMQEADELGERELDENESLGDIIMAIPFVQQEASRLKLTENDHILHLAVHGTLHLLGYDHLEDEEAEMMQRLENKVMKKLGLHQPYTEFSDEDDL